MEALGKSQARLVFMRSEEVHVLESCDEPRFSEDERRRYGHPETNHFGVDATIGCRKTPKNVALQETLGEALGDASACGRLGSLSTAVWTALVCLAREVLSQRVSGTPTEGVPN